MKIKLSDGIKTVKVDPNFAGAIALCVCTHKLCSECCHAGNPTHHDKHDDWIFGNRGIYFIILFIWIWSFVVISGDVFGVTSVYKWKHTDTIYGCKVTNNKYTNHTSYGIMINGVGNVALFFGVYCNVVRNTLRIYNIAQFHSIWFDVP